MSFTRRNLLLLAAAIGIAAGPTTASAADVLNVGAYPTNPPFEYKNESGTFEGFEVDIVNGADRWVFVGTGRLLDESDLSDDQIQSFYAFRDGTQKIPSTIVSGSPIIRSDLAPVTDGKGTAGITAHGWVHDLAEHSRIVSPYQAVLSVLVYSATKPQTDPCLTGQSADIFIRNFAQGVSQTDDSFSSTGVNCTADSCSSIGGAVDAQIVGSTPDGSTSPDLYVAITLGTTGQLAKIPVKKQSYDYSHRLSWRILSE